MEKNKYKIVLSMVIGFLFLLFPGVLDAAFVDVTDSTYGAVGDGVTDDTSAIASALADMGDGGVLYFPPGTYLVTDIQDLNYKNATIHILAYGATILSSRDYGGEATAGSRKPILGFIAKRTVIEGLTIGFEETIDTTSETVKNWAHALAAGGNYSNLAELVVFKNCRVLNAYNCGIVAEYARVARIENCHVENACATGIYTTCITDSLSIVGNTVKSTGDDAIYASYIDTFTSEREGTKTLKISKNFVSYCGEKGIGWTGAYVAEVSNNKIYKTHVGGIDQTSGTTQYGTKTSIIRGNHLEGIRAYAGVHGTPMSLNVGAITVRDSDKAVIVDNDIKEVHSYGSTFGIYIMKVSDVTIERNRIDGDNGGSGGYDMKMGIFKNDTQVSNRVSIRDNDIDNYTINGVEYRNATRLMLDDNIFSSYGTYGYRFDNVTNAYLWRNVLPTNNLATNGTVTKTVP